MIEVLRRYIFIRYKSIDIIKSTKNKRFHMVSGMPFNKYVDGAGISSGAICTLWRVTILK